MADKRDFRNDAFLLLTVLIRKSENAVIEPAGAAPRFRLDFRTPGRSKLVQEFVVPVEMIELAEPEENEDGDEIAFYEVDWQTFCQNLRELIEERNRLEFKNG